MRLGLGSHDRVQLLGDLIMISAIPMVLFEVRDVRFTLPRFRFYVYTIRPKTCAMSHMMSYPTLNSENENHIVQKVNLCLDE